ncbi:SET domain-containing protein-lysine N-methyltransferase [Mesorhizobium sp.]|uniref:SET domain-containing protein-lysine N-methyltransferase n=1 Tax=Mesorhizobium sp. TaxID=1871066 RepID=UPI000FE92648|nr:SET domain-containing protein-lysine N-methyltransferase [Mesorhizobium sp.]RWQ46528.1 MAG: SET domain-containing protein [Mesorhizobium sp.]
MTEKIFDRSNAIYVKNIHQKGRGVFANVPFASGEVIERAPTWEFDKTAAKLLDLTGLFEYYFGRPEKIGDNEYLAGYVIFGFTSIVNHSWNPNAKIVWDDGETGAWASIVAIKDIQVDEEITHLYTGISAYPDAIKFID